MFTLNNLSDQQVGPFGLSCQAVLAGVSGNYSVEDSEFTDFADDQNLIIAIQSGLISISAGAVTFKGEMALGYLASARPQKVQLGNQTNLDFRDIVAVNRIAAGYTVYQTASGDDCVNGVYGGGGRMLLTATSGTGDMQFLNHFYIFGGRVVWEGATLDDQINAWLIASPTTGLSNVAGNFNKVPVAGIGNLIVPAAVPGTGAWSLDLTAKIPNTNILQCTPVPSAGNNGYFDYDSANNVLTVNAQGKGGYNLFDAEVKLFKFANKCFGRKQDGAESVMESSDVVGKLLYNSWKIRFTLTPSSGNLVVRAGVAITTAVKQNV